jgi:predicted permease
MTAGWLDLRVAIRSLSKAPGFSVLAIVVLAAGIGVTSVVFSLVDGALIRPLPFGDPDRLVMLWERPPSGTRNRVSPLNFLDWSEKNHSFTAMAAVAGGGRTITGSHGTAERVPGQAVTTAFFDVLGIKPIVGRVFVAGDAIPQPNVVVVSERFWRSRMGGQASVVGRTLRLDGLPFTVVGVVPASFQILFPADLWTPFPPRRTPEQRMQHYLQVIARLKPDVTIESARSDMGVVADDIARIAPDTNRNWGVTIEPLRDGLVSSEVRATSLVLAGVVGFVLLTACANVANLFLARGLGRIREIAVRAAVGGSRRQILSFLMTETVIVTISGGCAGLALAWSTLRTSPSFVPPGILPQGIGLQFEGRVALFAFALTAITGVLSGLAPAWHVTTVPLVQALASGGRSSTRSGAFRRVLAIGEVTAAVVLLSGAGLLVRTLMSMTSEDPGFRADGVLTMNVSLPLSRYPSQESVLRFTGRSSRPLRRCRVCNTSG